MFRFSSVCLVIFMIHLSACGGGSSGGSGSSTPAATATPTPTATPTLAPSPTPDPASSVTISGTITYDFVPNSVTGGLDYDSLSIKPVRGASIQALSVSGQILAQTTCDVLGQYSLTVAQNTNVSIRVLAELSQTGSPSWDFSVTDNTSGNALYVMQGSLLSSGIEDSARDLLATSGWNGSSYSSERTAAPFAILDSVYEALQQVLAADSSVVFAPAELRWSVNNRAVSGSRSDGNINTSFYDPSENNMYILGDANNDTDEYDKSVIQHEWGHYLEDTLSRSDSIGGSHSLNGSFDMRLAFSEGFANAFSAIASEQPFYADSGGSQQSSGFRFSLETNTIGSAGWFSENSVGKIVYDIADTNDDGVDALSLGFSPIYNAMTSSDYIQSTALTSIYLFIKELKDISDTETDGLIDNLMLDENIIGSGLYGDGETNDGSANRSFVLPVYNVLSLGGTVNVCGNNLEGIVEGNGLDVRRFIRVNIPSSGTYAIQALTTLGTGVKDPDIEILLRGRLVIRLSSGVADSETANVELNTGEYILAVYDFLNDDGETGGGSSCFDVSINAT